MHFIHAYHTMVSCSLGKRPAVIHDVPAVSTRQVDHRVVTCTGGHGGILLKYLADPFKRACRRIGDGVGYGIVRTTPAAFRPHKIIFAITDEHERAFHISLRSDLLKKGTVFHRFETGKVRFHLDDVTMAPAPIDHVVLAVFVMKHKLVYRLCTVMEFIDERFAQVIFVRAAGFIRYSNADTAMLCIALYIIGSEKEIILAPFFNNSRRPHSAIGPFYGSSVQYMRMFFPLTQIVR